MMTGAVIMFYFLSILLTYVTDFGLRQAVYYVATALCVIVLLVQKHGDHGIRVNRHAVIYVTLCFLTGLVNNLFIGNITINKLLECAFLNIMIAALLIRAEYSPKWLLATVYVIACTWPC